MKPNFALTLSFDGIRLLHRAPSGWLLVGEAAFDAADMNAETAVLRARAARLDPSPMRTKLVIPNEQIKFMTVASTARTEAEAEDDAAHALQGATPYELRDLAFDWAMDDGQLFIAAVARETLAEAEGFATEHAFNPVSFVALPEQATFAGEPFFGLTKSAKASLPKTENVMRDLQPIHVIGIADIPDPEPQSEPDPQPQPESDAPEDQEEPENLSLSKEIDEAAQDVPPASAVAPPPVAPTVAPPVAFSSVRSTGAPSVAPAATTSPPRAAPVLQDNATPDTTPAAPAGADKSATAFASRRAAKATAKPKPKPDTSPPPAPVHETATLVLSGTKNTDKPAAVIGGKPRHLGLILTAILLIFMAFVAIWASFFTEDGLAGLFGSDPVQMAEPTPPQDVATAEEMAEAADVEPAGDVTGNEPDAAALALPDVPQPLSPEEAEQHYIATGIWEIAPDQPQVPGDTDSAEVYLASIDPVVSGVDAIALPDIGSQPDLPPSQRLSPAAAGTTYELDPRGLVKATPEGALTPEGIKVFAGPPPIRAPKTPTRFAQTPQPQETARLAGARPKARPENLVEKSERTQLGGRTRTELAALRPRLRQQTAKQLAEQDETPTAQAIALSLKPKSRPSNFSKVVQKAEKNQDTTAQVASVAPSSKVIPSSASVARQATVKNALDLRQVNLIGVYGKPSDRRALIRLSNGRYKKVQVGDKIDGGKVAAISDTELRYVKNGRSVVLKMPRG